ncbi:MAG: hypothetical protein IPN62_08800 [Flavobacteriales bacterium]|nr:hypothetical protein [Flavobacteriales bacterium]
MALGAMDVSLFQLVPAYGSFAMQGKRVTPQFITRITDASGKELYKAGKPRGVQALQPENAAALIRMLQRAVDQGTGTALRLRYGLTGPYAGKTGTSQDYSDAGSWPAHRAWSRVPGWCLRPRDTLQQRLGHGWIAGLAGGG